MKKAPKMTPDSIFSYTWDFCVAILPRVIAILIVLTIGWIVGRIIGKGISKILEKVGVDEAFHKTMIGRIVERSGFTITRFLDLIIRWFVYLVTIFAVVDILDITVFSEFMLVVVGYLPNLIAGVFILIVGFIVTDFIGNAFISVGKEFKIAFSGPLAAGLRFVLYFVIVIIALRTMKIDVEILYTFATALAWGIAVGACVGLGIAFGLGFKDAISKNAQKWLNSSIQTAQRVQEFWEWYNRRTSEQKVM
ncbi:mechanosensitive ion channel family protein [[Eubacterium] cellulosolvens]